MRITVNNDITLRSTTLADARFIFDAFSTQGNYLRQWLPISADFNTVIDVEDYIEMSDAEETYNFTIEYKGNTAGLISISHVSYANRRAEIGYWLSKPLQGNGIMVQSVKAIVEYAFSKLNMNRLEIKCAPENLRSRQIPIKLGFTLEGVEREGEKSADGLFNDLEVYSLLKNDFSQKNINH